MAQVESFRRELVDLAADRPFACGLHARGSAAVWVSACGELHVTAAAQFKQVVDEALGRALLVIVDLRRLTSIDSTGISLLVEADDRARGSGRRLVLVRGSEPVGRLLELLGFADRLRIVDLTCGGAEDSAAPSGS